MLFCMLAFVRIKNPLWACLAHPPLRMSFLFNPLTILNEIWRVGSVGSCDLVVWIPIILPPRMIISSIVFNAPESLVRFHPSATFYFIFLLTTYLEVEMHYFVFIDNTSEARHHRLSFKSNLRVTKSKEFLLYGSGCFLVRELLSDLVRWFPITCRPLPQNTPPRPITSALVLSFRAQGFDSWFCFLFLSIGLLRIGKIVFFCLISYVL